MSKPDVQPFAVETHPQPATRVYLAAPVIANLSHLNRLNGTGVVHVARQLFPELVSHETWLDRGRQTRNIEADATARDDLITADDGTGQTRIIGATWLVTSSDSRGNPTQFRVAQPSTPNIPPQERYAALAQGVERALGRSGLTIVTR